MNSSAAMVARQDSPSLLNIRLNQQVTFSLLIAFYFPSVTFSCFILYHIARKKQIRARLTNHVVLCVFFVYFIQAVTDLPLTMAFFYRGQVAVVSDIFCRLWFTVAGSLNAVSIQMNAFLSVERYLLIFHNNFVQNHKITSHYIPMIAILVILWLYVIVFTNFYPCENHFISNAWSCGNICYLLEPIPGLFTWTYGTLTPILIMVVFNALIIVRVIYQKQRMMQRNLWSRNKKMIFQLLSVTGTFYVSWIPIALISVINSVGSYPILREIQATWALIGLVYLGVLFSPVASYMAIPELNNEVNLWMNACRRRLRHLLNRVIVQPTTN